MPKQRGQERGNPLGTPVCPNSAGRKGSPLRDTCMPKQHGQERGSPLTGIPVCPNSTGRKEVAPQQGYLYAQTARAGKR